VIPLSDLPNGGVLNLPASHGMWTPIDVVASTGSTNADLLARAGAGGQGAAEGAVLVAEEQTAGRGRLGRSWSSMPGASLTFSVLLRPASVPPARRGWLPLLAGVAVATAVRSAVAHHTARAGVDAVLKWPNDVLVADRKLAGILAEQSPDGTAVVLGIGLNVTAPRRRGPLPGMPAGLEATSMRAEGSPAPRETLLLSILSQLERWYPAFLADPDPAATGLLDAYQSLCFTVDQAVRVELPGGRALAGRAAGIDADGRLLVAEDGGAGPVTPVSAGDVVHLRS
jgi:BirA family transcriptional regulator, biotin operon repressor / biotin---[acetyl-CoA-carboxylase] ligase